VKCSSRLPGTAPCCAIQSALGLSVTCTHASMCLFTRECDLVFCHMTQGDGVSAHTPSPADAVHVHTRYKRLQYNETPFKSQPWLQNLCTLQSLHITTQDTQNTCSNLLILQPCACVPGAICPGVASVAVLHPSLPLALVRVPALEDVLHMRVLGLAYLVPCMSISTRFRCAQRDTHA